MNDLWSLARLMEQAFMLWILREAPE
jgi:hypothetical protein